MRRPVGIVGTRLQAEAHVPVDIGVDVLGKLLREPLLDELLRDLRRHPRRSHQTDGDRAARHGERPTAGASPR